ncbi:MAG: MucB/RseB C-terminal domain-containing protein [Paludibacterium sp.]|uniref:MucB/RseB C-terminal domain-containing protein n=1 Tax=Paludibacterium sp. TaxID=1917523 RepID=UPI0025F53D8C|nr:MucB/RseB C-terminal domain-containing protein [Paludibacterium sp.]MBV8045624.1 MucB/RseB C-terminal domain-containing protein [Paludibacterium sp.]MBV8647203.1 MucB/RseB C-terminal domain-containing protein [Paludibacterium sp.]
MRKIALGLTLLALPLAALADDDWSLFQRVTDAGRQQPMSGTYLHQMKDTLETFHIVRLGGPGSVQERRVALDGPPREIVRNGEALTCFAPDKRSLLAAKISAMRLFPALMSDDVADISQSYTLRKLGPDRVAQRDCNWIEVRARDQQRYTERICADQSTSLPLKMMTLSPRNGDVIEQYTFTQIDLTPSRDKSQLKPQYKLSNQLRGPAQPPQSADGAASHTDVAGLPSGFKMIRSIQRTLPGGNSTQLVRHMVYSDGLVMLSLFVEPIPQDMPSALRRVQSVNLHGAINMATNSQGDQMLTLVGDMPEPTLAALVRGLHIVPRP